MDWIDYQYKYKQNLIEIWLVEKRDGKKVTIFEGFLDTLRA